MNETDSGLGEERTRNRWTIRRLGTAGAATALSAGLLVGGYGIASAATTDPPTSTPSPSTSADADSGTTNSDEGAAAKEDCPERGPGGTGSQAPSTAESDSADVGDVVMSGGGAASYDV